MSQFILPTPRIEPISFLYQSRTTVDVLRLDEIHPIVSGNKWYKLKEYLAHASLLNKKTIVTFGGAYSNHIVATAAACKIQGLQSAGIIRGEKPMAISHTLRTAMDYGMKLFFVSREDYKLKKISPALSAHYEENEIYLVNEGGYGQKGVEGAKAILDQLQSSYTHIIAAVGTGTTLAGLVAASQKNQSVIGIPVLKNNFSLHEEIKELVPQGNFTLLHQFHFGGYAKFNKSLVDFMNSWYEKTGIPSDFVYTGKLFFALNQLMEDGHFPEGSQVLVIHSGGLQGNESLPKGTLIF
jgi:1-aminocyclopropane-1-carboxylate deaminase